MFVVLKYTLCMYNFYYDKNYTKKFWREFKTT